MPRVGAAVGQTLVLGLAELELLTLAGELSTAHRAAVFESRSVVDAQRK